MGWVKPLVGVCVLFRVFFLPKNNLVVKISFNNNWGIIRRVHTLFCIPKISKFKSHPTSSRISKKYQRVKFIRALKKYKIAKWQKFSPKHTIDKHTKTKLINKFLLELSYCCPNIAGSPME